MNVFSASSSVLSLYVLILLLLFSIFYPPSTILVSLFFTNYNEIMLCAVVYNEV